VNSSPLGIAYLLSQMNLINRPLDREFVTQSLKIRENSRILFTFFKIRKNSLRGRNFSVLILFGLLQNYKFPRILQIHFKIRNNSRFLKNFENR